MGGKLLETKNFENASPISEILMKPKRGTTFIRWSGDMNDSKMKLETTRDSVDGLPLDFHSAYVLDEELTRMWCCPTETVTWWQCLSIKTDVGLTKLNTLIIPTPWRSYRFQRQKITLLGHL